MRSATRSMAAVPGEPTVPRPVRRNSTSSTAMAISRRAAWTTCAAMSGPVRGEAFGEGVIGAREFEHLIHVLAVVARQILDDLARQIAMFGADRFEVFGEGADVAAIERGFRGCAGAFVFAQFLEDQVHGFLGESARGGPFPADDRQHAGHVLLALVIENFGGAAERVRFFFRLFPFLRLGLRFRGVHQRAQPGVEEDHVRAQQLRGGVALR